MANTNTTEILTKIILRNDVLSAWEASSIILEKGEPALELIPDQKTAKFKIGNGTSTFAQLPYSTLTPTEISALIDSKIESDAVNSVSLAPGTNNGTLKITIDGAAVDNIAVTGLKSAAFTDASDYATAEQGAKADAAMPKAGGKFTGAVELAADPTTELGAATKQYVDTNVANAIAGADAMIFKGTLGTDGTIVNLPDDAHIGNTYKVITNVTVPASKSYSGQDTPAYVGDLVVSMEGNKWLVVPSGDEIVTTVKISTTSTNVDETAKSGSVVLGAAAAKQVASDIQGTENLPTDKAVKEFVEGKGYVTTDENVKNTPQSATKIYLTGTTSAAESTDVQKFNTQVYVDTDNKLAATAGFKGDLSGTASKASELTEGIKASLSGGVTGSAATAANAGGTIEVAVTSVNTDYIQNGSKVLVLNGGNATA